MVQQTFIGRDLLRPVTQQENPRRHRRGFDLQAPLITNGSYAGTLEVHIQIPIGANFASLADRHPRIV